MSTSITEFVPQPVARWRRAGALVAVALAVLALAILVLAQWNPWSSVVLRERAGDPVLDVFLALLCAAVAYLLGRPVTSEAAQHRRVVTRTWLIVLTVFAGLASLTTWGLQAFRYETEVIAWSADHQRAVAMVQLLHDRELHAFAGSGLATRDEGSFGLACGSQITARFTGRDQVRVVTDYGTFDLAMDPATGRPLTRIGPTCSG